MKAMTFDGITREMGERSNRRGFLRLLGGATALGAVTAVGLRESAEAKGKGKGKGKGQDKKKSCKNRCHSEQRCVKGKCVPIDRGEQQQVVCQPGTAAGSVLVPATGVAVSTPVLVAGQRYRLRATGFWATNATFGNDAFAAFLFATPAKPETTFNGVRLGLSVNGDSPDLWGAYNLGHVYEREVVGAGAALSLRYTDPVPADNSGSVTVEIVCA
jgi:hypothetical protein